MSKFRQLHLPQLLRKETSYPDTTPRFDCDKLVVRDRIGQGAFGDVYTADYRAPGKNTEDTVVIKKLLNAMDEEERKLFCKEVALLDRLKHRSIVKFLAVCYQPPAIMLEYVYFDFTPFEQIVRVSTLSDFLLKIDEQKCDGFQEVVCHAATEIIDGLAYLHSQKIAHRDLKTANILVSNQHYSSLSVQSDEFASIYQARPVVCKLTDFGESRSRLIQTQQIVASKTKNIDRGTVVYMAPELLVKEKRIPSASIDDLMLADIWALGMIIFTLINPSLKCPYILDIRSAEGVSSQEELKTFVTSLLAAEKRPLQDLKYEIHRATAWYELEKVYLGCTKFDRQQRLSLEEAGLVLVRRQERFSTDTEIIHLKVSQATALENFDHQVAVELESGQLKHNQEATPVNDGTNACAFLSICVAERTLHESETDDFFIALPETVEATIWSLPDKINEHRDFAKNYDVLEAYRILREQHIVKSSLEFSEELPFGDGVFTYEGREKLLSNLCKLGSNRFVAVYTSDPFVLTIGCHNGKPYVIDTHPVTQPLGNGNGLILVGKDNTLEVWVSLCVWIWQRLQHGGVDSKTAQSLAVVSLDIK